MKKVIAGILLVFAAVGGIFMVLVPHSDQEVVKTAVPRRFGQLSAHPADTLHFPAGVNLMNVFDGRIYCYSRSENAMYRADPENRTPLRVFQAGNHFHEIPCSIDIDSSGVWVFTGNRKAIFRFRENQPFPDSLEASSHPFSRGSRLTDSLFLVQRFDGKEGIALLERFNYRTGTGREVLHRFPRFNDHGLVADGQIVRNQATATIYFYQHHNADIVSWNPSSGKIFTFQTIDSTAPFNSIVQNGDSYSISSKSAFINVGGAADADYLYILSNAVSDDSLTIGSYVDLYHAADGQYAGSIRIPPFGNQTVRLIEAGNGKLYASFRNHVIIHQLQLP